VLQRNGIARAFENPHSSMRYQPFPAGSRCWSSNVGPRPDRGHRRWQRVGDFDSAAAFAAAVRSTKRSSNGLPHRPRAAGRRFCIRQLPEPAGRRIIDISGDGMANSDYRRRRRATEVAAGSRSTVLPILTESRGSKGYIRSNVIGGPGLCCRLAGFGSFAEAMLRKAGA